MKYSLILLNSVFVLIVLLFILDGMTSFEIKGQTIKSFTYLGIIVLTPLIVILSLITPNRRKRKIINAAFPFFVLIGIIIIGPMEIILSSSVWKTQKVLYQNRNVEYKKVEFQMQDAGALGYNRRTVEVTYLTDFFMIVEPIENKIAKEGEWLKVDKEINELKLKAP